MRLFEFSIPVSFQELEKYDRLTQPEYSADEIISGGLIEGEFIILSLSLVCCMDSV